MQGRAGLRSSRRSTINAIRDFGADVLDSARAKNLKQRKFWVKESGDAVIPLFDLACLLQIETEKRRGISHLMIYLGYTALFMALCFWATGYPQTAGMCEQALRTAYYDTRYQSSTSAKRLRDIDSIGDVYDWLEGVWLPETFPPQQGLTNYSNGRIYLRSPPPHVQPASPFVLTLSKLDTA
jgi:hypothetical protein